MLKNCVKCNMPDTRPNSNFIKGVCGACRNYVELKKVNWGDRKEQLRICGREDWHHVLYEMAFW